ncbi:MAG: ABC transporter ATP-binding protein [Candidatus Binatia bacterium]
MAIEDVSFEVPPGELVGFLGPNGAGKTTSLRILAGVFPPTSGRVRIAGRDMARDALGIRRSIGYFPERAPVYADMSVVRYLTYVGEMKGLRARAARPAAAAAMAACNLEQVAGRVIGTLSKGFRQRVGVAQALVGSPPVLILDEPTAGLDPAQAADLRGLISGLRGAHTVIMATHILEEVEKMCDRAIIVRGGRVLAVDTPENLRRRVRPHALIAVEINGPRLPVLAALRAQPGVEDLLETAAADGAVRVVLRSAPGEDLREALAAMVTRRGWGLRELRRQSPALEEIFLALIADAAPASEAHPRATHRHLPA